MGEETTSTGTSRITRSVDPMSQSMLMSAASIVMSERPQLESRPVGWILWVLMMIGLLSFVAGMTLMCAVGSAVLSLLANQGSVPAYIGEGAREMTPQIMRFVFYAMMGSLLYGFASFLWYKLTAARFIGIWASWIFFFVVPIGLILLKTFQEQVVTYVPLEGFPSVWPTVWEIAKYYSFFWYLVIFLIASYNYRTDVNEGAGHALTRWSLLAILCYIPYGYVLFVGEQDFFGPYLQRYLGDAQLIIWTLLPIRR